jgi:hypothetical protein
MVWRDLFWRVHKIPPTMADEAERPNPAIPQDRPENNQGRNGYQATIERIMRIMGCTEEEARRIFCQRGYLAVRNIHGAAGVKRLGRGHIDCSASMHETQRSMMMSKTSYARRQERPSRSIYSVRIRGFS